MNILDEGIIKDLVETVTELVGDIVKDSDDKLQHVKWFISELYNSLNIKYNIDGKQVVVDQDECKDIAFFWDIVEEKTKTVGRFSRGK